MNLRKIQIERASLPVFAGPNTLGLRNGAGSRSQSDDMSQLAAVEAIKEAWREFQTNNEGRFAGIEAFVDEQAKLIGRLQVGGGGGSPNAVRAVDAFNAQLRERHGQAAPQLTAAAYGDYQDAVKAYIRHGQAALDNANVRAALSVGSDPAGGYLVIPDKDPEPRERLFRTSPMRALADVVTIAGGRFEGVHEVDDFGFGWVGEKQTRSETTSGDLAAFGIECEELYALVPITQRLLDDAAVDVGRYIDRRFDSRFARGENTAFVTGNGVLKPKGFMTYKDTAVATADETRAWGVLEYIATGASADFPALSGVPGVKDLGPLYDVKAAMKAELRAGAVWCMNSSTQAFFEKLRDADGRSIWRASLDGMTPDRLLGYPVAIFEDMADIGADSFSVAFANLGVAYQIVQKPGTRLLRDPYTNKGKVLFYGYRRVGGDVVNFDAIKLLKFSSS